MKKIVSIFLVIFLIGCSNSNVMNKENSQVIFLGNDEQFIKVLKELHYDVLSKNEMENSSEESVVLIDVEYFNEIEKEEMINLVNNYSKVFVYGFNDTRLISKKLLDSDSYDEIINDDKFLVYVKQGTDGPLEIIHYTYQSDNNKNNEYKKLIDMVN